MNGTAEAFVLGVVIGLLIIILIEIQRMKK